MANQTSRDKVRSAFQKQNPGTGCLWVGHPNEKTLPIYANAWGIPETREAIYTYLRDDCRWFQADVAYKHPEGRPALDPSYGMTRKNSLGAEGCFAQAESVAEIESYPWPDPKYLDFTDVYAQIDQHPDKMVFSGMWSPFFHILADFFGMENYFINMHQSPELIDCATERMIDYYVAANDLFFQGAGDRCEVMFFGNDFGTQLDLFISPEKFRRFVLPGFKRLIEVGKRHGKFIMLHSCGSIHKIIPDLIDAGVDAIHPLQAQAIGMDAQALTRYKQDITFVGGIDAQSFFVNATPQQIKGEVRRVRELYGPNWIVSPSHEEILPNVPPENVVAMAEAALE